MTDDESTTDKLAQDVVEGRNMLDDVLDDATRSRLHAMAARSGGGKMSLYIVTDRGMTVAVIVVANGADHALEMIRDAGLPLFVGNTSTRHIQRNVLAEPGIVVAYEIGKGEPRPVRDSGASNRRTKDRKARRRRAKEKALVAQRTGRPNPSREIAGSTPAGCATFIPSPVEIPFGEDDPHAPKSLTLGG